MSGPQSRDERCTFLATKANYFVLEYPQSTVLTFATNSRNLRGRLSIPFEFHVAMRNLEGIAMTNVRFGSKADIAARRRNVRFVPIGDIQAAVEYDCVGKVLKFVEHPREAFSTQILTPSCRYRRASADLAPDILTVSTIVPGFEASQWIGLGAPAHTPAAIIERLNNEVNTSLADAKIKARLIDLGGTAFPSAPSEFDAFIAAETAKWGKVVKFANLKPE